MVGRFSDIDIDVRSILEADADMHGLSEDDKALYVDANYDRVSSEILSNIAYNMQVRKQKGNKNG